MNFSARIESSQRSQANSDKRAIGQVDSPWPRRGAAKGYAQPASQVTDNTNDVLFDLASAKGNGFADVDSTAGVRDRSQSWLSTDPFMRQRP